MAEKRKNRRRAVIGGLCLCLPAAALAEQPATGSAAMRPIHSPYINQQPQSAATAHETQSQTGPVTQLVPVRIGESQAAIVETPASPLDLVPVISFESLVQQKPLATVTLPSTAEAVVVAKPVTEEESKPLAQPAPKRASPGVKLFGGGRTPTIKLPQKPLPDYLP